MDASPCKKGAPIALSLPHFYGADRRLLKSVVGLKPDKSIHETYLNIEPVCCQDVLMAPVKLNEFFYP